MNVAYIIRHDIVVLKKVMPKLHFLGILTIIYLYL